MGTKQCYASAALFVPLLLTGLFLITSCAPNQRILNSAKEVTPDTNAPAPQPQPHGFEVDIAAMRNADFYFIYVFRRKDGAVLDTDDKRFLGGVVPAEINRRQLSDEGKAVILGSNYKLTPELMKVLSERFAFTDLSRSENETMPANGTHSP